MKVSGILYSLNRWSIALLLEPDRQFSQFSALGAKYLRQKFSRLSG